MKSVLGAALLCASATLVQAQDVTLSTARGEVTLDAVPETVVTLDLAILDILDSLDVPVAGVPSSVMPAYLADYAEAPYAQLGSPFEPDIERLAALQPDLLIVAGRSATIYDDVAGIAPTVDLSSETTDLVASVTRNVTTLGAMFDKEEEATAILDGLTARFDAVEAQAADAGTALVVLTTGGRMSNHGAEGRFAVIFNEMGFEAAVDGVAPGTHGQPISNEFILETNPDWIFVVDRDAAIGRDGQPAEQMLDNALVNRTTAAQEGQIVFLDAADWYMVGAGPTALNRALDQVAAALED